MASQREKQEEEAAPRPGGKPGWKDGGGPGLKEE